MRILILEDDSHLAAILGRGLEESGHVVDVEFDGIAGEAAAMAGSYDVAVLDVEMPSRSGLLVTRALRAAGITIPILMLTARDTVEDVVAGIAAGADDYLRKPFAFAELEARLHAIVRRLKTDMPVDELRIGSLVLDLVAREARIDDETIVLTASEFAFLEVFMRNPGRTLTRTILEDALWDRDRDTSSNLVDVYVGRLRAKLARPEQQQMLETVRGIGYRMRANAPS